MIVHKNVPFIEDYLSGRGYVVERKRLGPPPLSMYTFITSPSGRHLTLSTSALILPFRTSAAKGIMDNKLRAYDFAKSLGVRIPGTLYVSTDHYSDDDLKLMLSRYDSLIVKPHNGFQSRGLTTNIKSVEALKHAISDSAAISDTAVIQEQVSGEEIRLITINGIVKAALLRQKPQVVGDGKSSIAELIVKENIERKQIVSSVVTYPKLDGNLVSSELLHSDMVPAQGEVVKLSDKTMIRGGASVYDIVNSIDKSYIELAEKMAKWFGDGVSCVDLMIKDFTQPANADNYAFIEFNGAISIAMCYSCRDGKHFRLLDDYIGPMLIDAIG